MKKQKLITRSIIALTTVIATTIAVQGLASTNYVSQTSLNPSLPYSTPDTAAHTIQEAVDAANEGDTVLVAPDTYVLSNQVTVIKGIVLQSTAGAGQTFLFATQNGMSCLWISNSLAVADGFTVQQPPRSISARGAFLVGGTVQNCNFSNFDDSLPGGSVAISAGTLSNSIVSWFRIPGGDAITCTNGLIIDSQIFAASGSASGTAVSLVNSRLQNSVVSGIPSPGNKTGVAVSALSSTVVDCIISNNFSIGKGAGAYLEDSLMDRCIVTRNIAGDSSTGSGGGGVFETNSIVRNSLIVGNRAFVSSAEPQAGGLGGGVYMQGGALLNCTVSSNSAPEFTGIPGGGGGVYAESGGITNCIIYFNTLTTSDSSSNWLNAGTATFDHCCTAPDPGGSGNITQDPQFADFAHGDFHLAFTSPCIDAGTNQPWMADAFDLDGNPRVRGSSVDMGAYESPSPQELTQSLIDGVNALMAQGRLDHGHGQALLDNLNSALNDINQGATQDACDEVQDFIMKTQLFTRQGNLSQTDSQPLIGTAQDLRAALHCGST